MIWPFSKIGENRRRKAEMIGYVEQFVRTARRTGFDEVWKRVKGRTPMGEAYRLVAAKFGLTVPPDAPLSEWTEKLCKLMESK